MTLRLIASDALHVAQKVATSVDELLPPEEDGLLALALRPYLEQGILSFADLAALMVSGETSATGAGVQRLLDQAGQRIVGINETTRRAVREALSEANAAGYGLFQTAHGVAADGYRGIASIVQETYRGRAEAIARTEIGEASQAAATAQWRELGVQQQEIQDGEEDEPCAERNGTTVSIEEDVGLNHPNCLIGESLVLAPNLVALASRWFEGEVIVLRTATGNLLTCTPNHPILTPHGWVAAGLLQEGDDVVCCGGAVKVAKSLDPNNEHMPTRIDEMASSSRMAGDLSLRGMPVAPVDFHGDGGGSREVDIVGAAGLLLGDCYAARGKRLIQRDFRKGTELPDAFNSERTLAKVFGGAFHPSHGFVGSGGNSLPAFQPDALGIEALSFGRAEEFQAQRVEPMIQDRSSGVQFGGQREGVFPADVSGVGCDSPFLIGGDQKTNICADTLSSRAYGIPVAMESFSQHFSVDASLFADLTARHPGLIEAVGLCEVGRRVFRGHVYTLQTRQGWFIAEGIITENCTVVCFPVVV